jgi:hypothetical protein
MFPHGLLWGTFFRGTNGGANATFKAVDRRPEAEGKAFRCLRWRAARLRRGANRITVYAVTNRGEWNAGAPNTILPLRLLNSAQSNALL